MFLCYKFNLPCIVDVDLLMLLAESSRSSIPSAFTPQSITSSLKINEINFKTIQK